MTVLAVSHQDDMHIHALIWALAQKGVVCKLWSPEEFPERQRVTARMSNVTATRVDISSVDTTRAYDTVWARRVGPPAAISDRLAPADRPMALLEARRCIDGVLAVVAPNATWINPLSSARLADAKVYQLHLAQALGFVIPDTVISNDPDVIRTFVQEQKGNVVYKAFAPALWCNENNGLSGLFTAMVHPEILEEEAAITSCPGIYQVRLSKRADIRITFFGDTFYGGRILSQATEAGQLDFRADLKQEAPIEPYDIPGEALDRCQAFRKALGLLHGTFDFVEQADGTLVFLELNTMGQFLFLEERVPTLPLLDAFASFSLNPTDSFRHRPSRDAVAFKDFLSSSDYFSAREAAEKHLDFARLHTFTYAE